MSAQRPGDWMCPKCNVSIFASKDACRKCDSVKPATASSSADASVSTAEIAPRDGDWMCPKCNVVIWSDKPKCLKCDSPRPGPGLFERVTTFIYETAHAIVGPKCEHGHAVPLGWKWNCGSKDAAHCRYGPCRHGFSTTVHCYKCN